MFMSHTVSGQAWQGADGEMASLDSEENVPAWVFKLEGRLLEVSVSIVLQGLPYYNGTASRTTTSRREGSYAQVLYVYKTHDHRNGPGSSFVS